MRKGVFAIAGKAKFDEWLEPDNILRLTAWARDGYTHEQIAEKMGIRAKTLWQWRKRFDIIGNALKQGKEPYDIEIENALHDSAKGYFVTVKKPMKLRRVRQKAGEGRIEEEYVEYVDEQQYIPPQVAAQIFYLKNRKAQDWREKRETVVEMNDQAMKNMTTLAALINHPQADIDIATLDAPLSPSEGGAAE